MFILSFSGVGHSFFFYVPLLLHFITGVAEYVGLAGAGSPKLQQYLGTYAQTVKTNRNQFLMAKAKIEMIYLPIAVVLTLFNFGRLISTVVYVQYIFMRCKVSREFVDSTAELDDQIAPTINRIGLGGPYNTVKSWVRSLQARLGGR